MIVAKCLSFCLTLKMERFLSDWYLVKYESEIAEYHFLLRSGAKTIQKTINAD